MAKKPSPHPVPIVGMGVTYGTGADCYPGTICSVSKSGLSFEFQDDNIKRTSGNFIDGNWEGEFTPNTKAKKQVAKWTMRQGVAGWRYDGRLIGVGYRKFYQSPDV